MPSGGETPPNGRHEGNTLAPVGGGAIMRLYVSGTLTSSSNEGKILARAGALIMGDVLKGEGAAHAVFHLLWG